ncbi:MAG: heat-inducible transcriptional repressor HrcA [Elusimicrobia bacterium]|nr:heat-inducible transcriptional repressor HrcA [Elusimicrobiota bacterium]
MRVLRPEISEYRRNKTLQAIVCHYVNTNRPVSSNDITDNYDIGISSASVRKIMFELEKDGFLNHPYSSSGRIPTDKAYRHFVDSTVELQSVAVDERRRITDEYRLRAQELDELLIKTSHLLAVTSKYTGFTIVPKLEKNRVKNFQLVKIAKDKILAIIVTDTGIVRHQVVNVEFEVDERTFDDICFILNEKLANTLLSDLKPGMLMIFDSFNARQEKIRKIVKALSANMMSSADEQIFIDGASNIMSVLEKAVPSDFMSVLRVIEQKKLLAKMLEADIDKLEGVQVLIGLEHKIPELREMSLIRTSYKIGGNPVGVLGIIGPKRMEYSRMISLVDYVGRMVNKMIERTAVYGRQNRPGTTKRRAAPKRR